MGSFLLLLLALLAPLSSGETHRPAAVWPVASVLPADRLDGVLESFIRPACRWCPGRRGVWLAAPPSGVDVLAPWRGTVTFAGRVVGVLHVTIRLPSGALVTCGGLVSLASGLAPGVPVDGGEVLGRAAGRVFLSVRRHGVHVEPLTALGWVRPRLVDTATVGPNGASR
jgi:hypothetical protein